MSRPVAAVIFLIELALAGALLFPALIGLSFLHEVLRGAPMPALGQFLRLIAILIAVVPAGAVIWAAYNALGTGGAQPVPMKAFFTPALVTMAAGVLFVVCLHGAEFAAVRARRAAAPPAGAEPPRP